MGQNTGRRASRGAGRTRLLLDFHADSKGLEKGPFLLSDFQCHMTDVTHLITVRIFNEHLHILITGWGICRPISTCSSDQPSVSLCHHVVATWLTCRGG